METIKQICAWAVSPYIIFLVIQAIAWLVYRTRSGKKAGPLLLAGSLVFFIVSSLPVLTYESNRSREYGFAPLGISRLDETKRVAVMVMGTGYNPDPLLPQNSRVSGTAHARMIEAVRIYRAFPRSRLLVSIANIDADPAEKRAFLDEMMRHFDLDPDRVELITDAESTEDEARIAAGIVEEGEVIVIATSAGHMPRAMLTFQKAGLEPIAAPCDFHFPRPGSPKDEKWKQWLPSTAGMNGTHQFFYESLATVWQIIRGSS